jgi:hypothetical protein
MKRIPMTVPSPSFPTPTGLVRIALTAALAGAAIAQVAPGDLVVVRIGDGSAPPTSAATAVFLDEYTPAGLLVQTIPLPTSVSGTNQPLTNSGVATSEGNLQLSVDGRYLVNGGYAASVGTVSIAATTSAATPRVIARYDLVTGAIDTSTALTNAFSGNNIRSATSIDGTQFWASGANGGVQYALLGTSTATALNTTAPTNTRVCSIANGQLYVTSASGTFQGVSAVGTGVPNTSPQTMTLLNGFPTASGPSNYDFFFADPDTLYVADDRTNGSGGIQKWTQSAGLWTLQYTLLPAASTGCRGLTGVVSGGIATLYATTTATTANQIVSVIDTGAGAVFSTLATAATNTVVRGIRRAPDRGSIVRVPIGCGPATISTTGTPSTGGSVVTNVGNTGGLPFLGFGFAIGNVPFCTCTLGHDWSVALFGSTATINIPNVPIYVGAQIGIQGADLLGPGGCPAPQVALTDAMVVTIG